MRAGGSSREVAYDQRCHCARFALRTRSSKATLSSGYSQHDRHNHRVVRFLPLQHRDRPRFCEALFSELGSADRYSASVRHLRRGVCSPARWRGDLRALWRPHGPQGCLDRDFAFDGYRDLCCRLRSNLRPNRHLGRDHPHSVALHPGRGRRRRMGRLGSPFDGVGRGLQEIAASLPPGRNLVSPADCFSPTSPCSPSAPIPATNS
jgi:hypothetical protein